MRKLLKTIKKTYQKLKYMDKMKSRFFMSIITISAFSLFMGTTYSYFAISEKLNAATISIAKLKYQLTSTNSRFQNNSIIVEAGETLELTLDLKSLNSENTKYALNYSCDSDEITVYYVDKLVQNVQGEIAGLNSVINIKIAIENTSDSNKIVQFTFKGGYLQNELYSNITEIYTPGLIPKIVKSITNNKKIPTNDRLHLNESPDFTVSATEDEGIYSMKDDYGDSYYFRGAVEDNYVYFGGIYWRIIRVNGDGSVRMIYDGEEAYENGNTEGYRSYAYGNP